MWMTGIGMLLLSLQQAGPDARYHRSQAADGSGIWHVSEPSRPVTDQTAAAGANVQRVVVRFDDPPVFKPGNERACYLRARVIAVESGEAIRTGDLIQLRTGCASASQGVFDRLFPEEHLRAGAAARLDVDQNAELRRVELPFAVR